MDNVRNWKWDRLTREERKARRASGDAWWQQEARQERQEGRREKIKGFWDRVIASEEPPAPKPLPPGLGQNLPSPGVPGARNTGAKNIGATGIPPWIWMAALGTGAYFLLKK